MSQDDGDQFIRPLTKNEKRGVLCFLALMLLILVIVDTTVRAYT